MSYIHLSSPKPFSSRSIKRTTNILELIKFHDMTKVILHTQQVKAMVKHYSKALFASSLDTCDDKLKAWLKVRKIFLQEMENSLIETTTDASKISEYLIGLSLLMKEATLLSINNYFCQHCSIKKEFRMIHITAEIQKILKDLKKSFPVNKKDVLNHFLKAASLKSQQCDFVLARYCQDRQIGWYCSYSNRQWRWLQKIRKCVIIMFYWLEQNEESIADFLLSTSIVKKKDTVFFVVLTLEKRTLHHSTDFNQCN